MSEPRIVASGLGFAQDIENLLSAVLGPDELAYTAAPVWSTRRNEDTCLIASREGDVPLAVEGNVILHLSYSYQCTCGNARGLLQVERSSVKLRAGSSQSPFVSYDYVRDARSNTPAAHINVYASNDPVTQAMLACGAKRQGRNRRKEFVDRGVFPTFSSLHFPVGGDRMRPGLEDVLQMAVTEFGIDVLDGWKAAIEETRKRYRAEQLRALVREFPDIAFDTLRAEGLASRDVPRRVEDPCRESRLTRY